VQSADLLYWIGPDMEGFLPRVLKTRTAAVGGGTDLAGPEAASFLPRTAIPTRRMLPNMITIIALARWMPTCGWRLQCTGDCSQNGG
jgi:hypothetical protein